MEELESRPGKCLKQKQILQAKIWLLGKLGAGKELSKHQEKKYKTIIEDTVEQVRKYKPVGENWLKFFKEKINEKN